MPEAELRHHLRHVLMYLAAAQEHVELALPELEHPEDVRAALRELEAHRLESSDAEEFGRARSQRP